MAKRKAGVNDIIYELDNSDVEISSDDERRESKIKRFIPENASKLNKIKETVSRIHEVVNHNSLDSFEEITAEITDFKNGGKTESETTLIKNNPDEENQKNNFQMNHFNIEKREGHSKHCLETISLNESIDVDSPAANSDLSVVGCENRTPLVTVRFKDVHLAHIYKKQVKEFLLNLLKSQDISNSGVEDTDVEFDIWPEDLDDDNYDNGEKEVTTDDNLFFMDTEALCDNTQIEIPVYNKASCVISNSPKKEDSSAPVVVRGKITCFNCDGQHSLRDCPLPRDNHRIAEKRKTLPKLGRYHVEDDQKYGHLVPGRISGALRNALGLQRYELPLHIYKMRLLGYPPGWLEEARISHSGIRLFGASGSAILDPEEEDGEVCEPGSKDKFDIKKILDFPGFNVPTSSRYIDEAHLMGYPPMSEADSKMLMLQTLAPNAMKAYKRKKLMFFPANNSSTADGQMEMELDSGDEIVEFPSVPPLPDEAPPQPATPPPPPPECSHPVVSQKTFEENIQIKCSSPKESKVKDSKDDNVDDKANKSDLDNDLEVIEVLQVPDIPVPEDGFITIDEDYDTTSLNSSRNSPTLDDLEEKKRLLLSALKDGADSEVSIINISDTGDTQDETTDIEEIETLLDMAEKEQKEKNSKLDQEAINSDNKSENEVCTNNENKDISDACEKETEVKEIISKDDNTDNSKTNLINEEKVENQNESDVKEQSDTKPAIIKTGAKVKTTAYGTPVINVASPYLKLPSEDKFSKDICDVINFENLPNSIGKFKKISTLLKKVKNEVDRIHDS